MAAADQQRHRRVLHGIPGEQIGRDVADEVVDRVQRLVERDGERLRGADAAKVAVLGADAWPDGTPAQLHVAAGDPMRQPVAGWVFAAPSILVLGMFFVPLFYLLVRRLFPGRAPADATVPETSP